MIIAATVCGGVRAACVRLTGAELGSGGGGVGSSGHLEGARDARQALRIGEQVR